MASHRDHSLTRALIAVATLLTTAACTPRGEPDRLTSTDFPGAFRPPTIPSQNLPEEQAQQISIPTVTLHSLSLTSSEWLKNLNPAGPLHDSDIYDVTCGINNIFAYAQPAYDGKGAKLSAFSMSGGVRIVTSDWSDAGTADGRATLTLRNVQLNQQSIELPTQEIKDPKKIDDVKEAGLGLILFCKSVSEMITQQQPGETQIKLDDGTETLAVNAQMTVNLPASFIAKSYAALLNPDL